MIDKFLPHVLFLALAAPAIFSVDAFAEDQKWSLSVGYDQSTGEYGTNETTEIRFIPVTGKVERGAWTYKVMVPWLEVEGGSLIADGEVIPGLTGSASGLGDINVSVSYLIYPTVQGGAFLEVTGKVKAPTADEKKGLGTGAVDYTGMVSIFQPIDKAMLFADVGYRLRGKSDLYDLQDGVIGSVGASYKVASNFSVGTIVSYRESATGLSDAPADLMPYFTYKAKDIWSLTAYGTFGLTDSSPDTGFGLTVKRTYK